MVNLGDKRHTINIRLSDNDLTAVEDISKFFNISRSDALRLMIRACYDAYIPRERQKKDLQGDV